MKSKLGYKYIYKSIIKLQIIIFLYPNLAKNKLTLDIKGNKEKVEIFIYDLQGRVIKKLLLNQGQEEISFDVYNVRIINSNNNITKKLIIQ